MGRANSGPKVKRGSLARTIEVKLAAAIRGMDSLVRRCDERPAHHQRPDPRPSLHLGADPEPLGA